LWSYFPSKEALFDAMLDQATMAFRAHLGEILDPCGDVASTLEHFCVSLLNKITRPEAIALNRLVVAETGRFPEVGRIFHDRARGLTQRQLGAYLAGAMERGQLRPTDPDAAALALLGLALGGCHQRLLNGSLDAASPQDIQADVDRTLDLFLRAYRP
jgi:AcrR family transcriptional regulator